MRKLKLQIQITTDGYVAGPDGELDWMAHEMDELELEQLQKLTEDMGTILMGRKMADGFTSYWEGVVDNQPDSPEFPYAKIFVDTPKIVFSKTHDYVRARNVRVENGELATVVKQLKSEEGPDIIVYGGASFVSALIENKLIDDLFLFIHPLTIGNGLSIFRHPTRLSLVDSIACRNGIIINHYQLNV